MHVPQQVAAGAAADAGANGRANAGTNHVRAAQHVHYTYRLLERRRHLLCCKRKRYHAVRVHPWRNLHTERVLGRARTCQNAEHLHAG